MNENKPTFTVVETPATKVTVTISRRQLWNNFVECWRDIAWDDYNGLGYLKEVADILCADKTLEQIAKDLRELFRNGGTVMLMGEAMSKLDIANNDHLLREIIVTDNNGQNGGGETLSEFVVIRHEDIVF